MIQLVNTKVKPVKKPKWKRMKTSEKESRMKFLL